MVALRKGWGGHVVCALKINPRTGVVDEVSVVRHTHFPQIDAIMVMTLFKWRFRPGVSHTTVSYDLGVYGRSHDYHSGE
jgi:outer membrane biosynthesis protein TonB